VSWRRRDKSERSTEIHGIGDILDALMAQGTLAKGRPLGTLAGRWADVVGPKLAEETLPVRLERGVLTLVASTSAWAAQVTFLAPDIARKANDLLGSDPVREVRVQVGPERAPKGQNRRSGA
jgi:predicted nucleic acid-binding Zn ribbon protein